ncbi:hypothetical protein TBLA_0B03160 [Henningerozyma blattae CBS 6284]|uniref:Signal recognition particle SEC65 subunit n=1 Tax=Henningerozyma blattae (strain ATCC 34711 / CBS 6284 / DSM 70876 / NBRC 10599 / NRRL Y-10934 / UCD 77-7) TaxID=1071380 RepID=I2GYF5_HENB6|nr:hypothetical protein TBLA_0B03160 [Tetrapisispora blattae CBS 6284]CCH59157.1 hypothetical protein TBLA_0B03160 [Tetrapisispora blattae CBS 6284]
MPVLEEIEDYDDIDNLEMDLSQLTTTKNNNNNNNDISNNNTGIRQSRPVELPVSSDQMAFVNPQTGRIDHTSQLSKEEMDEIKHFTIFYPCYFDKKRSHKQGRRVPIDLAVENPLAKTMADAVQLLQLPCIFEADKTHPQDFGNPGRVRILLHQSRFTKNKVLLEIAKYMKSHPTTLKSPKDIPYGPDFQGVEPKLVPKVKGFMMNEIVPLHSPLLMGHPMTKNLYDAPPPPVTNEKQFKAPKNKYKVIRR